VHLSIPLIIFQYWEGAGDEKAVENTSGAIEEDKRKEIGLIWQSILTRIWKN
jgi:hypothetical protein